MCKDPELRLSAQQALMHPAIIKVMSEELPLTPIISKKTLKYGTVAERAILLRNEGAGSSLGNKVFENLKDKRKSVILDSKKNQKADCIEDTKADEEEQKSQELQTEITNEKKVSPIKLKPRSKKLDRKVSTSMNDTSGQGLRICLEKAMKTDIDYPGADISPTKGAVVVEEGAMYIFDLLKK